MTVVNPDAPSKEDAQKHAFQLATDVRDQSGKEAHVLETINSRFLVVVELPFRAEILDCEERAARDTRAGFEGKEKS